MSHGRLYLEWVGLLIGAVLLVWAANSKGWFERLDLQLLDISGALASPAAHEDIVLVQIDDASLRGAGTWPWDRSLHAQLVDSISRTSPRAIALDILFLEPNQGAGDARLGDAISAAGNVTIPLTFQIAQDTQMDTQPLLPLARIGRGAADIGHVAVAPDVDGNLRQFALTRLVGDARYAHLALSTAQIGGVRSGSVISGQDEDFAILYAAASSFRSVSAIDVMEGRTPPEFLRDKFVLVGATAQGLGDRYAVPDYAGRIMSGVEIQANVLAAVLDQRLITPASLAWVMVLQVASILLLFVLFWKGAPRTSLLGALALIAALVLLSVMGVLLANRYIPVAAACVTILLAYPVWNWRRLSAVSGFLDEEARKLGGVTNDSAQPSQLGFDLVARQVARLKRLTHEVSENLALTESLLNGSPDPMMVVDANQIITLVNDSASAVFGPVLLDSGEGLGEVIARNQGVFDDTNAELRLGDGRTFLLARAPLDPRAGSEILSFRDISSLKEGEQQQREMLEFLSHDMRSPQVAIIGLSRAKDLVLGVPERFSRIEEQARRTLKLTDDFVQIARLENDGLRREDTEVTALLAEALDRAFPLARDKAIKLQLEGGDIPVFAMLDPTMISRVLDNLVGNAVKFSPNGSIVRLALEPCEPNIITFSVIDEGPGLPAERLADPFAKFGAHDTRAGPSAGLGLAFVKKAVDAHGGTITVRSGEIGGCQFQIVLPADPA